MTLNITSKLKAIAVGAAVALLPLSASAATFDPDNSIILGESYFYQETLRAGGASEREFVMTAPESIRLSGEVQTLEFVGAFMGLTVSLEDADGGNLRMIDATASVGDNTFYDFTTVFNLGNSLTQVLVIKWDSVVATSPNGGAQLIVQATPSAIPVPAAGLLLLTAVGGAVALRRRKSEKAA